VLTAKHLKISLYKKLIHGPPNDIEATQPYRSMISHNTYVTDAIRKQ
jgi:hypothetical protein